MENSNIHEVTIDMHPEHFLSEDILDGEIVTELTVEDEIEVLQNMDQKELSRMIPGIHQQGLDYDGLKESVTIRAQQEIPIPDKIDSALEDELLSFFTDLDKKITQISGVADEHLKEGKPMTATEALQILNTEIKENNNESN